MSSLLRLYFGISAVFATFSILILQHGSQLIPGHFSLYHTKHFSFACYILSVELSLQPYSLWERVLLFINLLFILKQAVLAMYLWSAGQLSSYEFWVSSLTHSKSNHLSAVEGSHMMSPYVS